MNELHFSFTFRDKTRKKLNKPRLLFSNYAGIPYYTYQYCYVLFAYKNGMLKPGCGLGESLSNFSKTYHYKN